ncbi:MAG TPA: TetR family transcriptional regulator C-terminal domain-containing protein [Dongiaceae bacterium]|jgi:TetR/AcrR family transcriptional repressor of bet genes
MTQTGAPAMESPAPRRGPAAAELTRAAILAAATKVIAQHSLSGTTVERVAVAAGVAPATVILHFKRKEALLVAALEELAREFETVRQRALAGAADDPVAALNRLIDVAFDPAVGDPAKIAVWYAFWGEAGSRGVYLDRVGSIDNVYFADIEKICADLARRGGYGHVDPTAAAMGLVGSIEYLWQDIMVAGPAFDRERARRTVRAYLASLFPKYFTAKP